MQGLIPGGGVDILHEQMQRLSEQGRTKLGLTSATAIIIALWSANAAMKALFDAMNVAYNEDEKRGFVRLTATTLAFTLTSLAAVIVLSGIVVILPAFLSLLGLGAVAQWVARLGGFVLMFAIMTAGLAALYRWGPSRRVAQWRWITPGALVATAVTIVASALLTWYVKSFGSYNATYGSLGAVFGFMTWLWISTTIVSAGAELNAETEHQTSQDTTEGPSRSIGRSGGRHGGHRRPQPGIAISPSTLSSGLQPYVGSSTSKLEQLEHRPSAALGYLKLPGSPIFRAGR